MNKGEALTLAAGTLLALLVIVERGRGGITTPVCLSLLALVVLATLVALVAMGAP